MAIPLSTNPNSGTLAASGSTAWFNANGQTWFHASGALGGGTLTAEFLGTDAAAHDLPAFDATGNLFVRIPPSASVRITLAGATAPSVYWQIKSHPSA